MISNQAFWLDGWMHLIDFLSVFFLWLFSIIYILLFYTVWMLINVFFCEEYRLSEAMETLQFIIMFI